MVSNNHILVNDEVKKFLIKSKKHERETMNDILLRLLKLKLQVKNGR